MTNSLLALPHELPLIDRLEAYNLPEDLAPPVADKWLLVSNLQKSVRRGLVRTAQATALRMLEIEPEYFWRRLPVIALEDIGFGNPALCLDVLKTFRREALHRQLGVERVALYFVEQLASSLKSRLLCEALVMVEYSVRQEELSAQCRAMTDTQLLNHVTNIELPFIERFVALRHLCGYREFAYGRSITVTKARPDLMQKVVQHFRLSDIEAQLFVRGQSCTLFLNTPVPLVTAMLPSVGGSEKRARLKHELSDGILLAALDQYTRVGKKCIAEFSRTEPMRAILDKWPCIDSVAMVNRAVFAIEGECLDRWIVYPGSDELYKQVNLYYLERVGLTEKEYQKFLTHTKRHLGLLNEIRKNALSN
ncbi:MAG: hypothetical protein HZB95_04810 [Nitrosomonadales bacterium]|nr:hypothetical protein [Nitrosomonadales bacterium]